MPYLIQTDLSFVTNQITIMLNISNLLKKEFLSINFADNKISFCLCHHNPDRTIQYFGLQNYFCSRCQGILIGAIFSIPIGIFLFCATPFQFLILSIPLFLDGMLQNLNKKESSNLIRFFTGFCFAMGLTGVWAFV